MPLPTRSSSATKTNASSVEIDEENINMGKIFSELNDIKSTLKESINKKEIVNIVNTIVSKLFESFKLDVLEQTNSKADILQEDVNTVALENELLREKVRVLENSVAELENKLSTVDIRSKDALKTSNYNEQYSRKHNIRVLNLKEERGEDLRDEIMKIVGQDLNVELRKSDIVAVHRIPGKRGQQRPIILKLSNSDIKYNLMKNKKKLCGDIKFFDDITKRNLNLINRLKNSGKFEHVWYFNCAVYAKTSQESEKQKFDLFDQHV